MSAKFANPLLKCVLTALGVASAALGAPLHAGDRSAGVDPAAPRMLAEGADASADREEPLDYVSRSRMALYGTTEDTLIQPQDTNSNTDDHSVGVPTGWWVYTGVTAASVGTYLSNNSARLTDVEIYSAGSGSTRFTVRMVSNAGAYAVPGWWWYYGLTFAQVGSYLSSNSARLIDLEPYDAGGGVIRYAAVMVSNTGSTARAWSYLSGVTSSQISSHISSSGHRLTDLDVYYQSGVKRYSAVLVANTGSDSKAWQWWLNQTISSLSSRLSSFNGRLVDLERQADGTWNAIMVRNTGSDAFAWWWVPAFASAGDLVNYAMQVGARPVDIETYVTGGQRRYAGVFIDNSNAPTRRVYNEFAAGLTTSSGNPIGIFEAYLKRIDGGEVVSLNAHRAAETASSLKALHLLHTMRVIQSLGSGGAAELDSAFTYYDYVGGNLENRKNACPNPALETAANRRTNYDLELGVDEMMRISDNRTTRGVVLRYGFNAINNTAATFGLGNTLLRHNIGCAYRNLATGKYTPSTLRNNTSARDLAHIYEVVWNSSALTGLARTEFLESANPSTGLSASSRLQQIINEEATAQGKLSIADDFGAQVQMWSKGGSYGTYLPDSNGDASQAVQIRSGAGIIRLPVKVRGGLLSWRSYVFGHLISDIPVPCFDDGDTAADECPPTQTYFAAYSEAANEKYREEIRSALLTW